MSITALSCALLFSFALNLIHWRSSPGDRFTYTPARGWLHRSFVALSIGLLVLSVGALFRFIPADAYLAYMFLCGVATEFYSLGVRQSLREGRRTSDAA